MNAFKEFFDVSGLVANASKSKLYFGEVAAAAQHRIKTITGFGEGTYPMKYLGVPPSPKKWSKTECYTVIMKICGKIDCWTSKKL